MIGRESCDTMATRVKLPVAIETVDELQDVVDKVGGKLLGIQPGALESAVNSFVYEEFINCEECFAYTNDCCITGKDLCGKIKNFQDRIRFLSMFSLPTTSETVKHISCFFSGKDDVYLLQYDAR